MSASLLPPSGTATSDLLTLEFAEPPPAVGGPTATGGPRETVTRAEQAEAPPAVDRAGTPGSVGEHRLQRAYGTRERAERFYADQVLDHLNPAMAAFVERMEMAFVATADARGECDSSLRSGSPGFIRVLDERHLIYPEYRGNGVLASLGNISENPHVGILMVDFVRDSIGLHVNGKARIIESADLRACGIDLPAPEPGRVPQQWVLVEVEEAYVHCRKHIPRMQPAPRGGDGAVAGKGGDYFGVRDSVRVGG